MRVKCLTQEHNTMSLARARTRTARLGVEHPNHEAMVPPKDYGMIYANLKKVKQSGLDLASFHEEVCSREKVLNV